MLGVGSPLLWAAFLAGILALLALDLGLLHRRDRTLSAREALGWVVLWSALAVAFAGLVAWRFGTGRALDFLTGWLVEQSLSVDNLFVFVLVFATFRVPPHLQHRVLFWGILTALVLRGAMIVGGAALLARFGWLVWVFGAFLVATGVRLLFHRERQHAPERSLAYRALRRVVPATAALHGGRFVVRIDGRRVATPLFLALAVIEISDVVFALDSVPAVFAVTLDPFIVFTSNVFAILGLRSMYFAIASLLGRFEYLKVGLALVLVFVGAKMGASAWIHVPSAISLAVVAALLGGAMAYSVARTRGLRGAREETGA